MSISIKTSTGPAAKPAAGPGKADVVHPRRRRYEALAWLGLATTLVVFVPLFLRLAIWGDCTLFDLAARSLLRRGHWYEEVFFHGPPGMVWLQAAVRSLVGWSSEALRAADLAMLAGVLWLLARGAQPRDMPRHVSIWIAVVVFLCYTSATECGQCQSDGWMLLPALGALCLRQRQAPALVAAEPGRGFAWRALAEGVLWGVAFDIKPFVIVPAIPCVLLAWAAPLRALPGRAALRRVALDLAGLLAGGLLVGAGSVAALYVSGDWPAFVASTVSSWNAEYARLAASSGWWVRTVQALTLWVHPWGALHVPAVLLAGFVIGAAVRRLIRRGGPDVCPGRLPLLAAFYLGWFFQANYLQIQFEYQVLPAFLVAWALALGTLWRVAPRLTPALVIPTVVVSLLFTHPLLAAYRIKKWADCWASADSDGLKDWLSLNRNGGHVSWHDLRGVADYCRLHEARDREITCWNWSPIPLYIQMDVEPSTRFVCPGMRMGYFPDHKDEIQREARESPQRFLVIDSAELHRPPPGYGPHDFAAVHRSGRYVVLVLAYPRGTGKPE
jgi:hypothetical protein